MAEPDVRLDRLLRAARKIKRLRARAERWGTESLEEHFRRLQALRLPELPLVMRDHDPEWANFFAREKERLLEEPGVAALDVQHFGSTSIPPLPAKDIIDFYVAVEGPAVTPEREAAFARLGYELYGNSPVDPRAVWFWRTSGRTSGHTSDQCAYAAHVCERDRPWMTTVVNFRDFLRSHPEDRERYAEAKQRLAAEEGQDFLGYSVGKLALIGEVNEKAEAWIAAGRPV